LRAEGERGVGITLLAGGTDGRDGPTDAAGAVVDATTWDAIRDTGRDPAEDLLEHRSYAALDAVGALLRTGPSGTNVGDVVIGIVERPPRDEESSREDR
jgi:hydroxypyruvate reductase